MIYLNETSSDKTVESCESVHEKSMLIMDNKISEIKKAVEFNRDTGKRVSIDILKINQDIEILTAALQETSEQQANTDKTIEDNIVRLRAKTISIDSQLSKESKMRTFLIGAALIWMILVTGLSITSLAISIKSQKEMNILRSQMLSNMIIEDDHITGGSNLIQDSE